MSAPIRPDAAECGCCAGLTVQTPQAPAIRPGLSALPYRVGTHSQFHASLVAGLSGPTAGALAGLSTRESDDFTLGLFDALACSAEVLSFYQERLANESYLRTATERLSLAAMAELVGHRLQPGVAAETWLAFALEPERSPPPGTGADPGSFVTGIPASLDLPVGQKVNSVPGPGEAMQVFETVEPLHARAAWNAVPAIASAEQPPGPGATEAWLAGSRLNLRPGDALLLADPAFLADPTHSSSWDFRLLTEVTPFAGSGCTRVRWARGLAGVGGTPPQVHVLRRRAAFFGHQAPLWRSMGSEFKQAYLNGAADPSEWPAFSAISPGLSATGGGGSVDLDAVYGEVVPGSLVVLAKGGFNRAEGSAPAGTAVAAFVVGASTEASRAAYALSAKCSRLSLQGQGLDSHFDDAAALRATSVFLQSEALALAPVPLTTPVSGDQWPLAVPPDGLQPGRCCILIGRRVDDGSPLRHVATLQAVVGVPGGSRWTVSPPLPAPVQREGLVVHANVARASHGETAAQILGSGQAAQAFQRLELKRLPLTWRAAPTPSGVEAALTLRVGDLAWTRVESLFASGPQDRHFMLETDPQGRQWAVFGDGLRGARLPSGVNNVRASARQGLGAAGNLPAERLTQLGSRPLGLKGVSNPLPASGGTDPEPADQARQSLPLATRTLGRVVSVQDYEDFALAFAGIGQARARVLNLPAGRTVVLSLASRDGSPLLPDNPVWANLLAALQAQGDPLVPLRLLDHQPAEFRVGFKLRRDPAWAFDTVAAAAEQALRQRFGGMALGLAQPVQASALIATLQAVPGVQAVDLDRLYRGPVPGLARRLLAADLRVAAGQALPAERLRLAEGPLDTLLEMA